MYYIIHILLYNVCLHVFYMCICIHIYIYMHFYIFVPRYTWHANASEAAALVQRQPLTRRGGACRAHERTPGREDGAPVRGWEIPRDFSHRFSLHRALGLSAPGAALRATGVMVAERVRRVHPVVLARLWTADTCTPTTRTPETCGLCYPQVWQELWPSLRCRGLPKSRSQAEMPGGTRGRRGQQARVCAEVRQTGWSAGD